MRGFSCSFLYKLQEVFIEGLNDLFLVLFLGTVFFLPCYIDIYYYINSQLTHNDLTKNKAVRWPLQQKKIFPFSKTLCDFLVLPVYFYWFWYNPPSSCFSSICFHVILHYSNVTYCDVLLRRVTRMHGLFVCTHIHFCPFGTSKKMNCSHHSKRPYLSGDRPFCLKYMTSCGSYHVLWTLLYLMTFYILSRMQLPNEDFLSVYNLPLSKSFFFFCFR